MSAAESCDWLISAGWVVPVEPHGVVLEDHAVAVSDGRIVAIGPRHAFSSALASPTQKNRGRARLSRSRHALATISGPIPAGSPSETAIGAITNPSV